MLKHELERTKEWAEKTARGLVEQASVKHVYGDFAEALIDFEVAYGASNVILTQEDIDALSQGKTIIYTDGEYNHFINIEKS